VCFSACRPPGRSRQASTLKFCDLTQFYSPVSGGVKRYLAEKIHYLQRNRPDDTHLLVVPGPEDRVVQNEQSRIYEIASPLISRTSRYRFLYRYDKVRSILHQEHPDLIESSDPYQMAWKSLSTGDELGIPVLGFYHSHFPEAYIRSAMKFTGETITALCLEFARGYIHELYNRFARTVVPSEGLADVLVSWGLRNVVVNELGVDVEIFKPATEPISQLRHRLGLPEDRIILLYVGRLAQEKNTRTLFDAFELLNDREPGRFYLQVVGDGLQRPVLQALADRTGAVHWTPYCDDSLALAQYYQAADIFVHPGVQETFGLVTLESQAAGTPVVGIRGSYMDRIVFNDLDHWANDNHPPALAAAILRMSRKDLGAMGREAHERVHQRYAWSHIFDRLFAIYEKAIAEYRPGQAGHW